MDSLISEFKSTTEECIQTAKEELKGIRTGRASTGMIENLQIEAYGGTKMRLKDIATLSTEGATTLSIVPFDPTTVPDIEKGIMASPLGFNPQTEGSKIFIQIPPLSEEQRIKYSKLAGQMVEDIKNMVRREREEARKKIKRMEDAKEITEDDQFRAEKEIDSITSNATNELQSLREKKEKEIMEV